MSPILITILEAILQEVGLPLLLRWVAARSPQDQTQAILDAEYAAARAASDEEAKALLTDPKVP